MIHVLSGLLLRPLIAAAAVGVLVALPVVVLGEVADNESRVRAEAEMFEVGSGVAERAGLELDRRISEYRAGLARLAQGDLRTALPARDAASMAGSMTSAFRLAYYSESTLATRAAITDARGRLLMERRADDPGFRQPQTPDPQDFRGGEDPVALDMIPLATTSEARHAGGSASVAARGSAAGIVSGPYLALRRAEKTAHIAIGAPVFPLDTSRDLLGVILLELPIDVLTETVTPLLTKAEDIYVVGRDGIYWLAARPREIAPLIDLSKNGVVERSVRSQPFTTLTRPAVTLREYGADPFTGQIRPFATAVIEPWHVFVVPDRSTLLSVEATLSQFRWVRLGFALILVIGAFAIATAVRAVARQRAALTAANEALAHAGRTIELASRHKSEFLANMSHELRTPLNAIIGFSDVLEQKMFGELNAKQSEYLRDIAGSGRHLLDLVNEILDLAKVEAGRMDVEASEFSAGETIRGTLSFVRERAARHHIELATDVPDDLGTIVADERKMRQVLLNLLSNAVKFTPDGGWIGITARREDGALRVSVHDTGVGIASEDQSEVFEEFRQVGTQVDRPHEGTGLGLSLAKRFVELHGGRIWVESEVGKGSTFTFSIPVRQTAIAHA